MPELEAEAMRRRGKRTDLEPGGQTAPRSADPSSGKRSRDIAAVARELAPLTYGDPGQEVYCAR
jgi:hypothetical protein